VSAGGAEKLKNAPVPPADARAQWSGLERLAVVRAREERSIEREFALLDTTC
jgi:hypothetical protein